MIQQFKYLFTPLDIGPVTLRNRIVCPAHVTNFAKDHLPSETDLFYYLERAKGEVGLIITGATHVHPTSTSSLGGDVWNIDDRIIPWYQRISSAVHAYGAKILAELSHTGRQTVYSSKMHPLVAPSPIRPPERYFETPRELDSKEITEIIEAFGQAARRAKEGGLDGIELHGAHGNLIAQFMSPYANKRTDRYGGSLENRLRFALEVIDCVRQKVGDDFVVGMRISGDEFVEGGLTLGDMKVIAPMLEASGGLDFLDISASTYSNYLAYAIHMPPMAMPPGSLVYLSRGIKEVVSLPVIAVGRINDPVQAEKILADGQADLIGMCRAIICDPELPQKAREGRLEDIRACIACMEGCAGHFVHGKPITCIQNPIVGREKEWAAMEPAKSIKKVVVVGGGPSGMEAARVASLRGHKVTLYEKEDQLGGQVLIAAKAPFRENFGEIARYLSRQLSKIGVRIRLGVTATSDMIRAEKPDAVVVATGSKPYIPPIPGVEGENVLTDWDVLQDDAEVGENVVIIDEEGYMRGCSAAEFLADRGKKVEILTPLFYIGMQIEVKTWRLLYQRLLEKGVVLTPHTRVREIQGRAVIAFNTITNAKRVIEGVDTLVLAFGGEANSKLYQDLMGQVKELYAAGDCVAPRQVEHAIYEGHSIGRLL
jgi:mycofactocin system FadH/OYE family oxidoreductase 2